MPEKTSHEIVLNNAWKRFFSKHENFNFHFNQQVQLHPSILPADFDITPAGELVLNLPPSPADSFQNGYDPEGNNRNASASFNANVSKGISKDVVAAPQQVCGDVRRCAHNAMQALQCILQKRH